MIYTIRQTDGLLPVQCHRRWGSPLFFPPPLHCLGVSLQHLQPGSSMNIPHSSIAMDMWSSALQWPSTYTAHSVPTACSFGPSTPSWPFLNGSQTRIHRPSGSRVSTRWSHDCMKGAGRLSCWTAGWVRTLCLELTYTCHCTVIHFIPHA